MNALMQNFLAFLVGYAMVVLGTITIAIVLPNDGDYNRAGTAELVLAGLLVLAVAILAGYASWRIARSHHRLILGLIILLIVLETSWLLQPGNTDSPAWWTALSGLSIIAGLVAGAWWQHRHS